MKKQIRDYIEANIIWFAKDNDYECAEHIYDSIQGSVQKTFHEVIDEEACISDMFQKLGYSDFIELFDTVTWANELSDYITEKDRVKAYPDLDSDFIEWCVEKYA